VIRDLELCLNEGEFMVLVGPSGCAKSTTLRMIAGLESITAGDLFLGGRRANDLTPAQRNVSMVFQSYAPFPNMSVRENLSFGLRIRKTTCSTIRNEVDRVAQLLGLHDLLDRKPRQLSGGQAQRVALGRAMIRRPDAFLFDEPLSNLDAELRVAMRSEISRMQRTLATTTLYVTHDQVEAMTMGDRIAVMDAGRIMQLGSPEDLYATPANTFVASFIGSPRMNLLPAGELLGTAPPTTGLHLKPSTLLGIRPEHVLIQPAPGSITIGTARILRVENLGHEWHVHVCTEHNRTLVTRHASDADINLGPGTEIPLAIRPEKLHRFDPNSRARLP